ncbi:DUF1972 domain-containing protein [Rhodovulum sulfidophilum]|nr:DUF1972 domain-containing protein [Rhodovulum sulfidophilum]
MSTARIAILGTVGVPAAYGGFETLAENLVRHRETLKTPPDLTVYCAASAFASRPARYRGARLCYLPLRANGAQSMLYDAVSLVDAVLCGHDRLLLLGVSGALALPLVRCFGRARIVTNIDGIEWQRAKWGRLARAVLRASEWAAVRFSDEVITDNAAIARHVATRYGRACHTIPYGGDHARATAPDPAGAEGLPQSYALALCRIEPENNVALVLEAWSRLSAPLVFVGNWDASAYGRELKARYGAHPSIRICDPVYDPARLRAIRDRATLYVHGHSAGGTNPALVEMMQFGVPVLAHGCIFNRETTENAALYFDTPDDLIRAVNTLARRPDAARQTGARMREIAERRYRWAEVGAAYFALLDPAGAREQDVPAPDQPGNRAA